MDLLSNKKREENNDACTNIYCESSKQGVSMNSCFIDDLVDDLLIEILLRLPVKSAHRCKSVCKRWFSLISSPYFVHKYMLFCKSRSSIRSRYSLVFQYFSRVIEIACKGSSFKPHKFYFDFPNTKREALQLLGCCNGLVLCSTLSKGLKVYHVCNPLTRQCVSLPPPPKHGSVRVGFFCDETLQGFSRLTRYKVVLIEGKNFAPDTMFEIKIFSSDIDTGGGDWSEVSVPCPPGLTGHNLRSTHVVLCNGILHWSGKGNIVTYDLYNKPGHCNLIGFPSDMKVKNETIGVRQGRIQLSSWSVLEKFPITIYVWELKDYNTSMWCLKHKFHLSHSDVVPQGPYIPSDRFVNLIASSMDEDHIAFSMFLGLHQHLVLFNMKSNTFEVVRPHKGNYPLGRIDIDNCFPFFLPWWPTSIPEFKPKALQL